MGRYNDAMQKSLFVAAALVLIVSAPTPAHAIRCSDGSESVPATAAQAVNGVKVGDPVCPVDIQAGIDAEAGTAKQWLAQHGKAKSDCGTAAPESFQMLDSKFAVCAYKALQAYEQQVGSFTISSAFRSKEQQVCVCIPYGGPKAGKCGSAGETGSDGYALSCQGHWHQCGLAIDVNPGDGNYDKLHAFVQGKGVSFPIAGDAPHMMPAGGDCSGGAKGGMVGSGTGSAQTPTSGLSDMLRQYLGGGQQPTNTAAPMTNSIPASSQPFSSAIPASTGASTNPGVTTGTGATTNTGSYTTAVPSSLNNAYGSTPAPVSDSLSNGPTTNSTSTFDLLAALAGGTPTATQVATGTPLALNSNLNQVGTALNVNGSVQTVTLMQNTVGNVVALSPGAQQTFTSQDLQYSQGTAYVPPQNTTLQQRVLDNLKQALLKLLDVLRPFSYVRPAVAPIDAVE